MSEKFSNGTIKQPTIDPPLLENYRYFFICTISLVENHSKCIRKMRLRLWVRFEVLILKQILLSALWMTSHYLVYCVWRNNIVYYLISFREGWYGSRKLQCGDLEHSIKLCKINSIKTDNIDGYWIKPGISLLKCKNLFFKCYRILFWGIKLVFESFGMVSDKRKFLWLN